MSEPALGSDPVDLKFFLPPEPLRPFITTFYHMRISAPSRRPVVDWLHPEWSNIRLFMSGSMKAAIGEEPLREVPRATLTGPTSSSIRFESKEASCWGVGLLPLGLARFTDRHAIDLADKVAELSPDLTQIPVTTSLGGLAKTGDDLTAGAAYLASLFAGLLETEARREEDIVRVQKALLDPACHAVSGLAAATGMNARTLERFCGEFFGFPPQLLLRRQRFLRSLSQFMLDPSMKWIDAIDQHYHDQAHFVRDFKFFMHMTPREYSLLDHPVLSAAAKGRMETAGAAMQVLHQPDSPVK